MSIRIVNLRSYVLKESEVLVKVDRSSILGNPFYMSNESMRDEVCDQYDMYFNNNIKDSRSGFVRELNKIYLLSLSKDIVLGCWCYPKRCHAEVIMNYLNNEYSGEKYEIDSDDIPF